MAKTVVMRVRKEKQRRRGITNNRLIWGMLCEILRLDPEYRALYSQFELFFDAFLLQRPLGVENVLVLFASVKAKKEALQHLFQAVQEGLNQQLLQAEVLNYHPKLATALKAIAKRYFAALAQPLSTDDVRLLAAEVNDKIEALAVEVEQGLTWCDSAEKRKRLVAQIAQIYFAPDGQLRPSKERTEVILDVLR